MVKRLLTLLAGIILLVWFILFRPVFLGGPAAYIIVSGISMEPTLATGDLVVTHKSARYQVDDVIAYNIEGNNVIHRITGGSAVDGFITMGDNKDGIDPWRPVPEDIIGKLWLHFPGYGDKLSNLRQPQGILSLAGLAVVLLIEDLAPEKGKNRRGKRMKIKPSSVPLPFQTARQSWIAGAGSAAQRRRNAAWLVPLTITLLVTGAVSLALAAWAALQPPTRQETVRSVPYEHNAVFHYTVQTLPSALSPLSTIGPVGPDTDLTGGLPPVISEMAQSIDIDLNYVLTGPAQSDLKGEVSTLLQITMGDEWQQTFPLGEAVPFQGPGVNTRIHLPMDDLRGWVKEIEEQLRYTANSYTVTILPAITFAGTVDGREVEDAFTPPFTIQFRTIQAQMETELARSEAEVREVYDEVPNGLRLGKINLPYAGLKRAGVLGIVLLLLPGGLLGLLLYAWAREDEALRIQLIYGGMLIEVQKTDLSSARAVQIATMKDLVHLAKQYGGVVFHMSLKAGTHLFFIPDGQMVYTYFVSNGSRKE